MADSTTVRGLERGLRVFKALQQAPAMSLHEVHAATGLPKPSLLRLLATLERAGMVHRRLDDRRYLVSARLTQIVRRPGRFDVLAEAAAPVPDPLCQKIVWPSDLAVPAGDGMEIIETSHVRSPL